MSEHRKLPAVVVGMESNGLGVVRSLARENIPCIGFTTPFKHIAWKTRYARIVNASAWNKEAVISDLVALGKTLDARAPILITKDEPVLWISECRDELTPYFEINLPDDETVNLLMDKRRFTRLAIEQDWPIPLTFFIDDRDQLMSALPDVVYPCILKPAVKNSIFRIHSPKKAYKIFDEKSLIETYDMVAQWEKEVVIQEWIEGEDNRVIFFLTYYGRDGNPRALFPGRKLRQYPIECGNTAVAATTPEPWGESTGNLTQEIFKQVGFRGLGSVEFKIRIDNEKPVIMEPTVGRTNYPHEICVLNGCNIPAVSYYDLAFGESFPTVDNHPPVKLIDGPSELKASWEYFRSGRMTIGRWLEDRKGPKKYMILRSDDMKPFFASIVGFFIHMIRRTGGRAKRRILGN
jgi:predicted ATP-grasp superfamily ATP-dependent carboligase